jgi:sulfofructose kinase
LKSAPFAVAVGAVCATRIYQVDTIPAAPAKALARRMTAVVDGMAISALCAFVKLGGRGAVWARVGDDAQGDASREALRAEGIEVEGLHTVPGAMSSQAAVIVDARGERLVVPYHDPAVDASPRWLPLERLARADMLLADVRWPDGAEAALRAARVARPGGVPCMLDGELGAPGVLGRLVPLATHVVFSDAALLAWRGRSDLDAALVELAREHPGHVGASCGAAGYAWVERDVAGLRVRRVEAPRVDVVDTLAAGDVFHGAFALGLCEGLAIDAAARFACTAASIKCSRFGGRLGCPTRDEVTVWRASPG